MNERLYGMTQNGMLVDVPRVSVSPKKIQQTYIKNTIEMREGVDQPVQRLLLIITEKGRRIW